MTSRSTASEIPGPSVGATQDRTWLTITLRTLASTVGGYVLVYWLGAAIAVLAPMPRSEAVYLVGLFQILVFAPLVLWIFTTRSVVRMLAIMTAATAACVLIVRLHGHG